MEYPKIQVALLLASPKLAQCEISRRGLAQALLTSVIILVPIRREMFAP